MRWVRSPHFRSLLLLLVLTALPYVPALFGPQRLAGHDLLNDFYPWKSFLVREVHQGRLPLWNPYVFSGTPFAGNPQTAAYYPLDAPVFFMPLERFFPYFFALHAFLAAAAMYFWIHRHTGSCRAGVLSGLAWAWSGYVSSNVLWGFTGLTAAAVYLPLGMLCVERWFEKPDRRAFAFLSGVAALEILAGHPQPVLYTGYLLVIYALCLAARQWRIEGISPGRGFVRFLGVPGALLFAGVISAIVILPAIETASLSAIRAGGVSFEYAAHDSLPPLHLATLAAPFFFGDPAGSGYWLSATGYQEIGLYAGILILVFAASAWQARPVKVFLIAALAFSLLGALGSHTPFFRLLYLAAPGFKWFRVPARMLIVFNFSLAALAGLGVADLLNRPGRPLTIAAKSVFGALALLEVVAIAWIWIGQGDMAERMLEREMHIVAPGASSTAQLPADVRKAMWDAVNDRMRRMHRSTLTAILWTIAAGLLIVAIRRKAPPGPVALGALIILILDLGRFSVHLVPSVGTEEYAETAFPESETVRFLEKDPEHFRILETDDVIGWRMSANHPELYPERPSVFGIETVRGYSPTILGNYSAYINRMQGRPAGAWPGGLLFLPDARRMDREMLDRLNVKYLVSYQPAPATFETVLTDRKLEVYRNLEAYPRAYVEREPGAPVEPAAITCYTPNRVDVEAELDGPGTLVLADPWSPGWKAKVDGKKAEIREFEGIFRAVDLPAGKHEVEFAYAPASFYEGLALSCAGVILFIGLLGFPGKAKMRSLRRRIDEVRKSGAEREARPSPSEQPPQPAAPGQEPQPAPPGNEDRPLPPMEGEPGQTEPPPGI